MLKLIACTANVAFGAVDADITALADAQFTPQNSHIILPEDSYLRMAYILGVSVTRAKIDSPTFRRVILPSVRPIERAALPPNRPLIVDYDGFEPLLPRGEEIKLLVTNNLGAATEQEFGLFWITDRKGQTNPGPVFTLRATAAVTLVANQWALASLTLDQTLGAGTWAIVGMDGFCTNGIAARLVFPQQVARPGCLVGANAGTFNGQPFRFGNLGEWGRFTNLALPQLEVLGTTAGAQTAEVYLDLVRLSGG